MNPELPAAKPSKDCNRCIKVQKTITSECPDQHLNSSFHFLFHYPYIIHLCCYITLISPMGLLPVSQSTREMRSPRIMFRDLGFRV